MKEGLIAKERKIDMTEMKNEVERAEDRSPSKKPALSTTTAPSIGSKRSKRVLVASSKVRSSKSFTVSKSIRSFSAKSFAKGSQYFLTGRSRANLTSTPSVSFPEMETDDMTKDHLWQEFFRRYPELDKRLRMMRFNLVNAMRDKEEAGKNAMKLRCRLDDAKLKLEDAQWRRKATLGDAIGPDGHEIRSEAEKEAALEVENINKEFLQARQQASHTHAKYMDILVIYNDLNETARLEFQEYMNKVYTTTLILPELESENFERHSHKSESLWSISGRAEGITEEEDQDEQRTYFEHLQMSHGKNLVGPPSLDLAPSCRHIKCLIFFRESELCRLSHAENKSL